jgi:YidC/Oxa1 family membrane protein insertase
MQKMQPKLNALKAKYKDDREGLNKATMELYKAEGFNPAGQMMGCLPMFIQMPLWVALWTALNNSFELRHQPFFLWIKDLAAPDALIHFSQAYTIPIISSMIGPVHSLNILPLIMVVSMILQQKFAPQSSPSETDPAQAKQQQIMFYFMGIFFGLLFYNAPSGLNLYILTSNFLGILETRRVRRHLEAETKNPPRQKKAGPNWLSKIRNRMEDIAKEYEAEKEKAAKGKSKGKK